MTRVWNGFFSYAVIGTVNTLIHWQLFFFLRAAFDLSQAMSNFLAFCTAASFSFYANGLYTFDQAATVPRYVMFMVGMGSLSLAVGYVGDHWRLPGIFTVVLFSLVSLVIGFAIAKWLVFRAPAS